MKNTTRLITPEVRPDVASEVVGLFDDLASMQHAIEELELNGFDRRHLSVRGSEQAMRENFGTTRIRSQSLEDNPDTPRGADIKKQDLGVAQGVIIGTSILIGVAISIYAASGFVTTGTLFAIIIVGVIGGAILGGVLAKVLSDQYAQFFQKQINHGGILLWVNIPKQHLQAKVVDILKEHGARDVHPNELAT